MLTSRCVVSWGIRRVAMLAHSRMEELRLYGMRLFACSNRGSQVRANKAASMLWVSRF